MAYTDMRQFVAKLDAAGELVQIDAEVDPVEELGAICREMLDQGGPAILFTNIKGYNHRLLANMMGTTKRAAMVLECAEDELIETYGELSARTPVEELPLTAGGPCKEVHVGEADLDLDDLVPQILSNPDDGGPFLNYGLMIVKDPDTGIQNMGVYRLQRRGGRRTGFWSMPPSHGAVIRNKYEAMDQPMEVAVCIGADPMLYLASQVAGLDLNVDELKLAAAMRGQPFDLVKAETVDLMVPANCEIVLEGKVLAHHREAEGPYGEYPGYYGPVLDFPVVEFHHATHRQDPIYAYTYMGIPPTESHVLFQVGNESGFLRKLRNGTAPTVVDVHCPPDAHTVIVSMKKTYEEQAKHVMYELFTSRLVKTVIVVDEDVDPRSYEQVFWALANRFHADEDIVTGPGACTIGPSAQKYDSKHAIKMGMDATEPLEGYPAISRPRPEMMDKVRARWGELMTPRASKMRAKR